MDRRVQALRPDSAPPRAAKRERPSEHVPALLAVQRQAGNRATAMLVQRATAQQTAAAKKQADSDFEAGNTAEYFAGNFLANHIENARPEVQKAKGSGGVSGSKQARSQAWKKFDERANVTGGGTGWGAQRRETGTNTLILDLNGVQTKALMRAVNVAQIDELSVRPPQRWIEFYSDDRVPAVTFSSDGRRQEQTGRAHLGARYDAAPDRFRIDHLSGVG